jgi:hypothetical protein
VRRTCEAEQLLPHLLEIGGVFVFFGVVFYILLLTSEQPIENENLECKSSAFALRESREEVIMSQSYAYDLALPPRSVPWLVRGQVLCGGVLNQLGWAFLGFGLIFVWGFGLNADLDFWLFRGGKVETAQGVVLHVERTTASENDTPVYAYDYSFRVESLEAEFRGISYSTGNLFEPGQPATVEYLADEPAISRIQNTRRAIFGPEVICVTLIFPLVGLGFLIPGIINGLKANRLLAQGKVGLGTQKSMVPTNTRINKKTVYKLTFEFVADNGGRYEVTARSHLPHLLSDEAQERLLYDPANPAYAVMLDNLPGSPRLDDMGRIQATSLWGGVGILILPALTLLVGSGIFLSAIF